MVLFSACTTQTPVGIVVTEDNGTDPVNITNDVLNVSVVTVYDQPLLVANVLQVRSFPPRYVFLDENGNGTGNIDAIGDYSTNETIFWRKPPEGFRLYINRLLVHVKDTGSLDSGSYGNNVDLTNGIDVRAQINGENFTLTEGHKIFTNADWATYCYDVQTLDFGLGDSVLAVRWTFAKSGQQMILDGDLNDKLEIVLNDDFTDLNAHQFQIQGFLVNKSLSGFENGN